MIRTSQILFWFGLMIVASIMLYQTSDRVNELDQQLRNLNTAIDNEQQSLHILKAEWVYLANPARIEKLARKHLALTPTSTQKVVRMQDLNEILPTRSEAVARVTVISTPIASVRTTLPTTANASTDQKTTVASSKSKTTITVASADTGHINEHMTMERTASAEPLPDSIGMLLNELDTHP